MELTTLKKKVNPNENNAAYLEATLKKHYPNVYKDMIKNDYIITTSDRIQRSLDNTPHHGTAELQNKNMQMVHQLDKVIAGKQKSECLSNPIRWLAQHYVDNIAKIRQCHQQNDDCFILI